MFHNLFSFQDAHHEFGNKCTKVTELYDVILRTLKTPIESNLFEHVSPDYDSFKDSGLLDVIVGREGIYIYIFLFNNFFFLIIFVLFNNLYFRVF